MLNSALDWPQGGELDIMEHVGREPGRIFSTVHAAAAHGAGKQHFVYPNPRTGPDLWPFDTPQFLILNIAVGGDLGGAVDDNFFPVRMEIDHVRVYQQK